MRDGSPVSRRSSTLFGIHSESKAMEQLKRVRAQNRRFTFIAAGSIFLLAVTLICLIIFDMYNNSHVDSQGRTRMEHLNDLIAAQQWKSVADVELESAEQVAEDKVDVLEDESEATPEIKEKDVLNIPTVHSNHRYFDDDSLDVSSVKPRPFSLNLDAVSQGVSGESSNSQSILDDVKPSRNLDNTQYHRNFENPHYQLRNSDYPTYQLRNDNPYNEQHHSQNTFYSQTNRVNNIQDILALNPSNLPPVKPTRLPTPAGFTPPVHFRGVYIQPKNTIEVDEVEEDRNKEHYRKINNYFSRMRAAANSTATDDGYEATTAEKGTANTMHADIQAEAQLPDSRNSGDEKIEKSWRRKNVELKRKSKPFTVMLDIYPMGQDEEDKLMVDGSLHRPKDIIYVPIQNNGQFLRPQTQMTSGNSMVAAASQIIPQVIKQYFPAASKYSPSATTKYASAYTTHPKHSNNRMVMKLNMFPRDQPIQSRSWGFLSRQEDGDDYGDDYGDDDTDEDEGEGEEHHCHGVVGHNPYGKPISAKWKDHNGDLIHAKYVALKQWDRVGQELDPR